MSHLQWSGKIPHDGPVEECKWCNPKLRKTQRRKDRWGLLWRALRALTQQDKE